MPTALTKEMVIERIVRETSLSEGDVSNALISDSIGYTDLGREVYLL